MKKLLFLVFLPLSVWSQDTLVTPMPVPLAVFDTAEFTLSSTAPITTFRFLNPDYGPAFWNKENLAEYIVDYYDLTAGSSQFEIVSAVADFNKRHSLHVNSELVQSTTSQPGGPFSIVDHWSLQCGNYADIVANLCLEVTNNLGITPILFRRVSLSAHQIMEYYDSALAKWIYMDPDPGTSVFVPRDNGNLVSFSEIQANPDILLDTTTSVWWTTIPDDAYSRQQYKTFMMPLLSSVTYPSPNYMVDSRDMLYRLPQGAVMEFMMVNDKICTPIDSMAGMETVMEGCVTAFMNNDSAGISDCIASLSSMGSYDPAFVLNAVMNGNVFISHDAGSIGPKDSERFCSVTLQPGDYTLTNLQIPNLLRSIEPENAGIEFQVNGMTYTDSADFEMYWPSGTSYLGNPQYVNPSTIQYGVTSVHIPESVGSLILTFHFNNQLFQFWQQQWEIIVYEGELETSQIDSTGTTSIQEEGTNAISVYPNPTQDTVYFSEPIDQVYVYSMTGTVIQTAIAVSLIDLSLLPSGLYILALHSNGNVHTHKIIKE